ncbi:MAG: hypothetical protein U0521_09635 [Anaerolineae bacterium]
MTAQDRQSGAQRPRLMMGLLVFAGLFGMVIQFIMPDSEMLAFMVGAAAVGGLVGAGRQFEEREQLLLSQAFSSAFQWLLVVLLAVSAFYAGLAALHLSSGLATFVSAHWTGLMVSGMCLVLGIAGYASFRDA